MSSFLEPAPPRKLCEAVARSGDTTGQGVEIRLLAYFVAVAEEQSFSRGALRLYMSQPPLTRAIKVLEARLGIELLKRRAGAITLTPAGEELLLRSREILALHGSLVSVMDDFNGDHRRTVRLGFSGPAAGLLPAALLRRLLDDAPGLDVRLVDLGLHADADAVNGHGVDMAILAGPAELPAVLASLRMAVSHVVVAQGAGDGPDPISVAAMPRVGLVSAPQWPTELPSHDGLLMADSHDEALDLVAGGRGVFYTLDGCAQRLRREDVRFSPLEGSPQVPVELAWRAHDPSPGVLACARAAAEIARSLRTPLARRWQARRFSG